MRDDTEERIRIRAHKIWEEDGCPEGRASAHWDIARLAIAMEDARESMQKPVAPPQPEPIEAVENQGEFPGMTDQGETQIPHKPGRN